MAPSTSLAPPLAPRLKPFGTTIFAEMSALAKATGAINLSQGFPNFEGPALRREAAKAAIGDHTLTLSSQGIDEGRRLVRFAFCKDDRTLKDAPRRLQDLKRRGGR